MSRRCLLRIPRTSWGMVKETHAEMIGGPCCVRLFFLYIDINLIRDFTVLSLGLLDGLGSAQFSL